ncbi:MAG TPA: hypothetical protein VLA34_01135, partial [Candidatus Krumholzibacterium sp.]|nr:hypothetical protein [Candidatus Krumholzibacterium sp.]
MDGHLPVIESGIATVIAAIEKAGISHKIEDELRAGLEEIRSGAVDGDDALFDLAARMVTLSRPFFPAGDLQQAWGDLFTGLIDIVLASPERSRKIIELLYGSGPLPEEAGGEFILCINPGSTSTKLGLYSGTRLVAEDEVHLPPDFEDSIETRTEAIIEWMARHDVKKGQLTGIACRGGFVKPVPSGTYRVCPEMVEDIKSPRIEHASNMAIPIGMLLTERYSGGA